MLTSSRVRAPIKFNRAGWPAWVGRLPIASEDPGALVAGVALTPPEFSRYLSTIKFGTTFKSTFPGRHANSNRLLAEVFRGQRPTILDIGASDGSTSIDLIRALGESFERYYVTDHNISIEYGADGRGATFFRDREGRCILCSTRRLIVYSDVEGAPPPMRWAVDALLRGARGVSHWSELLLVQPSLVELAAKDPRVVIQRYDLFTTWPEPVPDLIKIANVLNRAYFSETRIAEVLLRKSEMLREGGRLLLLDNRGEGEEERYSLMRKVDGRMVREQIFRGGCEVESLIPIG